MNDVVKTVPRRGARAPRSPSQARVAVVGCGYWGKNLVRNFAELGALAGDLRPGPRQRRKAGGCEQEPRHAAGRRCSTTRRSTRSRSRRPRRCTPSWRAPRSRPASTCSSRSRWRSTSRRRSGCATSPARADRRLMVGHLLQYHPAFLKLKRPGARGRARAPAVRLFEPAQPRKDPARGGHPLELRAARHLDDPVARRQRAGARHGGRRRLPAQDASPTSRRRTSPSPAASARTSSCRGCTRSRSRSWSWSATARMAVFDDGEPWERKLLLYPHRIDWRDGLPVPEQAEAQPCRSKQAEPLRARVPRISSTASPPAATPAHRRARGRARAAGAGAGERRRSRARRQRGARPPATEAGFRRRHRSTRSAYVDEPVEIGAGTHDLALQPRPAAHAASAATCTHRPERDGRPGRDDRRPLQDPEQRQRLQGRDARGRRVLRAVAACSPTSSTRARRSSARTSSAPTLVRRGATIGANATIVCGTTHRASTASSPPARWSRATCRPTR